jgi:hypothetical protein
MLTNDYFIPARDPGSLDGYTDSLRVHMRSIIASLRGSTLEVGSGCVVHSNIPQSSIGEYLAWELVVVLMRLDPCTFEGHGPILTKPVRKSGNDIGIVWLSLPLLEIKKGVGSSDRTFAVTFPLVQDFGTHRIVTCKLVYVIQRRGKSMELTADRTRFSGWTVDRACPSDELLPLGIR